MHNRTDRTTSRTAVKGTWLVLAVGASVVHAACSDGSPTGEDVNSSASASTASCPISVVTNSYDTSYDGYITYKNTGTVSETNPTVTFTVPSGATLDTSGCAMSNQTA